jgi:hypothetical protein
MASKPRLIMQFAASTAIAAMLSMAGCSGAWCGRQYVMVGIGF